MRNLVFTFVLLILSIGVCFAQKPSFKIAVLKYRGGGDWYANPTSLPNLIAFCNNDLNMNINPEPEVVDVGSPELFNYPFVHLTGHGTVTFDEQEAQNLRAYLLNGGFLHIDDNYGLDAFIRPQMQKVFPELEFELLPDNHPIFSQQFQFPNGLPKIHEHDKKPSQALGVIKDGRLICLYTHECDLGDGWEDREVHNDTPEVRQQAFEMGANMLMYVFGMP